MTEPSPSPPPARPPGVILFTDGACSGNPGPGGWAYILRHPKTGSEKVDSGGAELTTNNQMELQAVIEGLKALKRPSVVEIVTDSQYVAKGSMEWLPGWKKNNWQRKVQGKLKPLMNSDRWQELDALLSKHKVKFTVIRGHAGHPENERCDALAVAEAARYKR